MHVLDTELEYFNKNRKKWFEHHAGKIVVIHGTTVHGFYDNYANALQVGYDKCGIVSFLLKEVLLEDKVIFMPFHVVLSYGS